MRAPNQCFVEITQKCNLHCQHCFANAEDNEKHMDLSTYKHVIDELYDFGVIWIGLTGGEALLNPQFFEMIEHSRGLMKAQSYILLSNGTLWNEEIFQKLKHNGQNIPLDIQISLDGHDFASYQKIRGGVPEDFESIVQTFKKVVHNGFHSTAFFTATDKTLGHALETARFALEELGVDCFQVAPLFVSGRALNNFAELEFLKDQWKEFLIKVTEIKRDKLWGKYSDGFKVSFFTLYELLVPLMDAGMEDEIKNVWGYDKSTFLKFRDCYCEAAKSDVAIDFEGKVFPCVPAMRTEFVGGDLKTTSLKEIWAESSVLKWFREAHYEVIKREPCKSCAIKDVCGGGCRISAYYLTGDKYAPDPRCPLVQK